MHIRCRPCHADVNLNTFLPNPQPPGHCSNASGAQVYVMVYKRAADQGFAKQLSLTSLLYGIIWSRIWAKFMAVYTFAPYRLAYGPKMVESGTRGYKPCKTCWSHWIDFLPSKFYGIVFSCETSRSVAHLSDMCIWWLLINIQSFDISLYWARISWPVENARLIMQNPPLDSLV